MKKYLKIIVASLVALLFVGTFVFLWAKSRPKEMVYEEFTPRVLDLKKTTVITGKIEPRTEINVKPQMSGIISEVLKVAGQTVTAGEVIAKIKVIPDMGQLSSAQARVRLANINVQRMKTLFDKGLIAAEEFEKTKQAYKQNQEEVKSAVESLEVVRDGVSKSNAKSSSTLIRSTISGLILDIPVKVGNTVILSNTFNDGTTIATVADMSNLIFRGNIDETEVGRLVVGMPMKITIGALQDETLEARLEYISPKAIDNNGANQFEIKAAVTTLGKSQIRSGYSANAEIILAAANHVLTIPESAVEFEGNNTYVYVVQGSGKTKTYVRRKIVTGLSDGINIEVKQGLTAKDHVRGAQKMDDAAKSTD